VPGKWCSLQGQMLPSERPCRAAGVARLWGAGRASCPEAVIRGGGCAADHTTACRMSAIGVVGVSYRGRFFRGGRTPSLEWLKQSSRNTQMTDLSVYDMDVSCEIS
jgi:hypothetical protein